MTSFAETVTYVCLLTVLLSDTTRAEAQLVPAQPPTCNATLTCSGGSECVTMAGCQLGYCACLPGWREDKTATNFTCVQATKAVGANCTKDAECMGGMTYCASLSSGQHQCACSSVYYLPTSDATDCTPQPLGANCTAWNSSVGPFCGGKAECSIVSGTCECIGSFRRQDNFTCTALAQGDPCNATRDCVDAFDCAYAACVNATYQCNSGYTWTASSTAASGGLCALANATLNLGQGEACDGEGPYRRVCAAALKCDLCPENSVSAPYTLTCVGEAQLSNVTAAVNQTTTSLPNDVTTIGTLGNTTLSSNSTSNNSTAESNSALATLQSSTCLVLIVLQSLMLMLLPL